VTWEHRGELRADPGSAPGERNYTTRTAKQGSIWPSIAVVAAAGAFGGVIWFAYHNGRDSSTGGQPPLVRAETGPVKVKPDQPGGQEIPFQDSTVYDRLGQGGGQKPAVEKILPPPETPVARPQPQPQPAPQAQLPASEGPAEPTLPPAPDALPPPNDSSPTALAPPPGAPILPVAPPTRLPASAGRIQLAEPTKPAQTAVTKPAEPKVAAVKPAQAAPPRQPAADHPKPGQVDSIAALESRALAGFGDEHPAAASPAAHKSGSYRVQLSSVHDADAVNPEWTRLKHRFPELASLSMSSGKTDVPGKGTFYRLQAGPLDEAGAKSTCDHLRAQGLACIVVKP
jgi:hypothetical protein